MNNPQSENTGLSGKTLAKIFLAVGVLVFLSIFALNRVIGWYLTDPPPGDLEAFDPIAELPEIAEYVGPGSALAGMVAEGVRADGTVDLTASYRPVVKYDFVQTTTEGPKDAPPVGAGGSATGVWYVPTTVHVGNPGRKTYVRSYGSNVNKFYAYVSQGMKKETSEPQPTEIKTIDPLPCTFKDLWDIAIREGAPQTAVATINYDKSRLFLRISDLGVRIEYNADCTLKSS